MNSDGSNQTQVTFDITDSVNPAWSPDGTRIAFQSYRDGQAEIYVMNADGSGLSRLTASSDYDGEPSWSPDGKRIAFVSRRTGGYRVYIMKADGSAQGVLSGQAYSGHPAWSPDGSQIAYEADGDRDGWLELWLMHYEGFDQHMIFEPQETETDAIAAGWSPDGRFVTFTRSSYVQSGGVWYWLRGFPDAWDTVSHNVLRLSATGKDWYPDWRSRDITPPTTSVSPLPAMSAAVFTVTWSGFDTGGAGLAAYDVQVSDNGGAWQDWRPRTGATSDVYTGRAGHTYAFRCRARDNAWNYSAYAAQGQARTTVESLPPVTSMVAMDTFTRGRWAHIGWDGYDPGGSGIKGFDVQWRETGSPEWRELYNNVGITSTSFYGLEGHSYELRARGIDRAGNVESWHGDNGETGTTFYTWAVRGAVRDMRDNPIEGAVAVTSPAAVGMLPSNRHGIYTAFVGPGSPTYTVGLAHSAYGLLPGVELLGDWDKQYDAWLPPAANAISNGDFEPAGAGTPDALPGPLAAPQGWLGGGEISPSLSTVFRHSGQQSAVVGEVVEFTPAVDLSSGTTGSEETFNWRGGIAVDHSGDVHAVWMDKAVGVTRLLYAVKANGHNWATAVTVSFSEENGHNPDIAVDSADTIHVVWGQGQTIMYASKPKGGVWSGAQAVPTAKGYTPSVTVDKEDSVHVIWSGIIGVHYNVILHVEKPSGGAWLLPESVRPDGAFEKGGPQTACFADASGTLHAVWAGFGATPVGYASKPLHGPWTIPIKLDTGGGWLPSVTVDALGAVHVAWSTPGTPSMVVYTAKPAGEAWITPTVLFYGEAGAPVIASSGTDLFLVWNRMDENYNNDIFYAHKAAGAEWDQPLNLSQNPKWSVQPAIAIGAGMAPHVIWRDSIGSIVHTFYRGLAPTVVDGDSFLSQVVTVPVTLPAPTLSFLYQTRGQFSPGGSSLAVRIGNGQATTTIYSTTNVTTVWTHRWLDLSAWAGQTVTLTFAVHQAAGPTASAAYLDEVALGSVYPDLWVEQAAAQARPGEPLTLTITYGNRGPVAAGSARLTATLPVSISFMGAVPLPLSTSPLVWDLGDLPASSGPLTITLAALAPDVVDFSRPLTSTVAIGALTAEMETQNNTSVVRLDVSYRLYLPLIVGHR